MSTECTPALPQSGIFAVYKPVGPTSHDVVDLIRRLTGERCVGHAGTLDPLARGVLVVGVGRAATKQLHAVTAAEKEYVAAIRFGSRSVTDDAEGPLTSVPVVTVPTEAQIRSELARFVGTIDQVPPSYSAVKVGGTAAYRRARSGAPVPLEPRRVTVYAAALVSYRWPDCTLRLTVGAGTYIRSIARDLGQALGTGGYVVDLERIRVGHFIADQAVHLPPLTVSRRQ
ncbi:MAG: tRNA pseudouridine(55) synthase TruB [Patescibacteria group bacterium]